MSKKPRTINEAINAFEDAVRAEAFRGNHPPGMRPLVRREYEVAKENLLEFYTKKIHSVTAAATKQQRGR